MHAPTRTLRTHLTPLRSCLGRIWDVLIFVVIVWLMYSIPYEIAFEWWTPGTDYLTFGYFADMLFWVDIILNFQ